MRSSIRICARVVAHALPFVHLACWPSATTACRFPWSNLKRCHAGTVRFASMSVRGKTPPPLPRRPGSFGRSRTPAERWTGIFRQSLVLTSTNPHVLSGAAAGGAGTTLMLTALRSGLADAVIVVGRDANRPWVPQALITDSEDEVIRCGQTSYCLTPNLQLLSDPRFKRIALVGVPCEVQAVRKMQNLVPLPEVAEKVVLAVEIACASSTKLAGTEFLITEKLGIPLQDVTEMRYREGEYPGEFTVKTRDGQRTIAAVLRGRRRVQTSQDAPLSRLRRLVVRSRRRLHFRRRSQYLCEQPERGEAASAVHRDDADGAGRKDRASRGSTRPRHRQAESFYFRGQSRASAQAVPLRILCRGHAQPGSDAAGRLPGNRDAADRHGSHRSHVAPYADWLGPRAAGAGRRERLRSPSVRRDKRPRNRLAPPGDKAIAQRAAFAAALAGRDEHHPQHSPSDDIESNLASSGSSGSTSGRRPTPPIVIGAGVCGVSAARENRP